MVSSCKAAEAFTDKDFQSEGFAFPEPVAGWWIPKDTPAPGETPGSRRHPLNPLLPPPPNRTICFTENIPKSLLPVRWFAMKTAIAAEMYVLR